MSSPRLPQYITLYYILGATLATATIAGETILLTRDPLATITTVALTILFFLSPIRTGKTLIAELILIAFAPAKQSIIVVPLTPATPSTPALIAVTPVLRPLYVVIPVTYAFYTIIIHYNVRNMIMGIHTITRHKC